MPNPNLSHVMCSKDAGGRHVALNKAVAASSPELER